MKSVSIEQAQEQLPELIYLVEQGEEVVIQRDDLPAIKLVIEPVSKPKKRKFGQHRGKVRIKSDFDKPLPDSFWLDVGIKTTKRTTTSYPPSSTLSMVEIPPAFMVGGELNSAHDWLDNFIEQSK